MSKSEGKRGFVASQPKAQPQPATAAAIEWDAATAAEAEALRLYEAATSDAARREAWPAWQKALERLIGTPAPSGEAVAYKLGKVGYLSDVSKVIAGPSGVLLSPADHAEEIARDGNELEKALLAIYLDLKAQGPAPLKEAEPSWRRVAEKARFVQGAFGMEPEGRPYAWLRTLDDLERKAAALARKALKDVTPQEAFDAAVLAERLARDVAEDPGGYRNYAVNPDGLAELAEAIAAMQSDARELGRLVSPPVSGLAIEAAFFSDDKPEPPSGPRGGGGRKPPGPPGDCPAAAIVRAMTAHVAAELKADEAGDTAERDRHYAAREALAERLVTAQATSPEGALGQLLVAYERAEVIRGNPDQATRDRYHDQVAALGRSAFRILPISDELWNGYIGGARDGSETGEG